MILCECGQFVENRTFKDYVPTSQGPSTPTFGHADCGLIFDFIDGEMPKRYSSKVELKSIAIKYAEKKSLEDALKGKFLLEVDRLKSQGNLSDMEILRLAFRAVIPPRSPGSRY